MRARLRQALRHAARALVIAVAVAMAVLAALQRSDSESPWIELSRFLPYYWLLLPCVPACAAAVWLGWRWVAISAIAPLLLATSVTDLAWNSPPPAGGAAVVRLMTYNSKLFTARPGSVVYTAVEREVHEQNPDILVMQDSDGLLVGRGDPALHGGPPLFGLPHVFALSQYVVASRLPILGCEPGRIDFPGEGHRFLQCRIDAHGTELTVATAHFGSPRLGLVAARLRGIDGETEWSRNLANRMAQSSALALQVKAMPRPLIVAGDFNASVTSPVVRQLAAAGLRDSFSVAGRGYGFSYGHSLRAGLSFLRIDHVMGSAEVEFLRSVAGGMEASEHRPVIADFILKK